MTTWIHTWGGRKFDLLHPDPNDVHLEDIAWSLAAIQRYTGHGRILCSVAEHSCRVADALMNPSGPNDLYLGWRGLCHDAHEAYIGDWSSPLKRALRLYATSTHAFDEIETRVWSAVAKALAFDRPRWSERHDTDRVRQADLADLALEAPAVLPWPPPHTWTDLPLAGPGRVEGWSRERAAEEWLRRAIGLAPTDELRRTAADALERIKATHGSYRDKHQSFEQALVAMRPWHCSKKRMAEMPCKSCLPYFNALDSIRNERMEHLQRIRELQEQVDEREDTEDRG